MNAKRKWYDLILPGLAVLVLLAAGAVQTANAEYVQGDPEYDSDKYESETGPGEDNTADSSASPEGSCESTTWNECSADGEGPENTYCYAYAWASWMIDWEWNGPPAEAPGGTLTWSNDFDGNAYAYGNNVVTSGSAEAASDAYSDTGSEGTEGSASGFGSCWGYVVNHEKGEGMYDGEGNPEEDYYKYPIWSLLPASYSLGVTWSFESTDNNEDISSGTTYVYFGGGVGCDSAATANAYGTATSDGASDSLVHGSFSAEFSSN